MPIFLEKKLSKSSQLVKVFFMFIINPLFLELETGALEKLNKIATLSATKSLANQTLEYSTMQDFFFKLHF